MPDEQTDIPSASANSAGSPTQPEIAPPEAVEALRKLQEQRPGTGMSVSMAMGAMPNPIQQKVNESHITLVLETAKQTGENEYQLKKQEQKNAFLAINFRSRF